jgi:hypothetical protein
MPLKLEIRGAATPSMLASGVRVSKVGQGSGRSAKPMAVHAVGGVRGRGTSRRFRSDDAMIE